MDSNNDHRNYLKMGYISSLLLTIITVVTFGFAISAIPSAGPYCPGHCMDYPFPDILLYYPRDYYWMYLAVFQLFVFVVFIATNHFLADTAKRLYTFLSVSFALISSTVLLITYFTQFSVVPISVMNGEADGVALITQYNEHGLFIAMEELGYICMSIALFFLAFAFSKSSRIERAIHFILIIQIIVTILVFIFYVVKYGIERSYRFEVATISINWLVLIATGVLIGFYYRRKLLPGYSETGK